MIGEGACRVGRYCRIAKEETERHPMNQNILINHGQWSSVISQNAHRHKKV